MRNTSKRIATDEDINILKPHLNCGDCQAVHRHNSGETGIDTEKGREFQIQLKFKKIIYLKVLTTLSVPPWPHHTSWMYL